MKIEIADDYVVNVPLLEETDKVKRVEIVLIMCDYAARTEVNIIINDDDDRLNVLGVSTIEMGAVYDLLQRAQELARHFGVRVDQCARLSPPIPRRF